MMYQGYRSQISNKQLTSQLDLLEEIEGKRLACRVFGVPLDQPYRVREIMNERIVLALWQVDNWDWVCEIEANAQDHADLIDTQECSQW